jgi:probable phosphoglycerate mutase
MSVLYLIRHGETPWSLSGQHTGRTDIPLTSQGEQDVRTLAEALRRVKFSRSFTSPRQRARQTCELVGLDAVAEIEPDLVEWDYGDYEGQRSVDIRKHQPDWSLFRDGCPHGESPAGVADRADRLIAQLRTLQGNVAIFSHGHFGRVLAARWMDCQSGKRSLDVEQKNRATEIIEDFMIAANGVTARYLAAKNFPSIRRVVRTPKRWDRIVELAQAHGQTLPVNADSAAASLPRRCSWSRGSASSLRPSSPMRLRRALGPDS